MLFGSLLAEILLLSGLTLAQKEITDDTHISNFVTRPEIRAPKWKIKENKVDLVSEGYWFVSPYHELRPIDASGQKWDACQIGAHIYDKFGHLVWSGACLFENRNVFDFKLHRYNGSDHLSMLTMIGEPGDAGEDEWGSAVVLDDHFEQIHTIKLHRGIKAFNLHEMNIVEKGKEALVVTWENIKKVQWDGKKQNVFSNGFKEFNLEKEKLDFSWSAYKHVSLNESDFIQPSAVFAGFEGLDYFHMNSVDKFKNGDFLISSRYTNCIYRIDGETGDIVWRFGGKGSDFKQLDNLNFSRQHHARIMKENKTHVDISFLDNAAGGFSDDRQTTTADHSRGMFVSLNEASNPMKATLQREYHRPDGGLSRQRGSVQQLDNGNVFICWSGDGYITEHAPDGEVLLDIRFQTGHKYNTYRGYKFNATLYPSEPPVAKSFAYGATADTITTVVYMSWNGATRVAAWNIYAVTDDDDGAEKLIGKIRRQNFESQFMFNGYVGRVLVEALDENMNALERTKKITTKAQANWAKAGFQSLDNPSPLAFDDVPEWTHANSPDWALANGEEVESTDSSSGSTLGSLTPSLDSAVVFLLIVFALGGVGAVWWFMTRKSSSSPAGDSLIPSWFSSGNKYSDSEGSSSSRRRRSRSRGYSDADDGDAYSYSDNDDDNTSSVGGDIESGPGAMKLERISEEAHSRERLADPDEFEMSPTVMNGGESAMETPLIGGAATGHSHSHSHSHSRQGSAVFSPSIEGRAFGRRMSLRQDPDDL